MCIDFSTVWILCYFEALNFQGWNTLWTQEQAGSIPKGPCSLCSMAFLCPGLPADRQHLPLWEAPVLVLQLFGPGTSSDQVHNKPQRI